MIRFDADRHAYTVDGVPVPSVTQVISMLFPTKYDGIPADILEAAADYGNRMHEWVETYAMTGRRKRQTELMKLSTKQVEQIVKDTDMKITSCEQMVAGEGYCGTYDMLGTVKGKTALIDIKTTAEMHREYLEWQLGMYAAALDELPETYYCLWIPKGAKAELIEITPKTREDIDWLIFRYEEEHSIE